MSGDEIDTGSRELHTAPAITQGFELKMLNTHESAYFEVTIKLRSFPQMREPKLGYPVAVILQEFHQL